MIVGCYVLHLYCRYADKHDWHREQQNKEYANANEREAKKEARMAGWTFSDGDVTCPGCNKDRRKK